MISYRHILNHPTLSSNIAIKWETSQSSLVIYYNLKYFILLLMELLTEHFYQYIYFRELKQIIVNITATVNSPI